MSPTPQLSSYARAINRAMREEMERDPSVVAIGLDIAKQGGLFGATRGLLERFGPDRVIDAPISEAGYTGAAIGMAMEGLRPVVEMQFADFVTVAFDQIATVAAKMFFLTEGRTPVPLVVRMPYGSSLYGNTYMSAAGPHHSQSPEAWFCHLAGVKVVMPSSVQDALGLLKSAIRDNNPVMFFEHKGLYHSLREALADEEVLVPIGKADIRHPGDDVTVIATGAMVQTAMQVAQKLAADGISVEVLDPRTLVPLDRDAILTSVAKTGKVVVAHEAPLTGGYGGEIAAVIAEEGFDTLRAPIRRVCARDMPVPAGMRAKAMLPSGEELERAIRSLGRR
jgi:pyruvate/2-oxoglutarate/acetoin dehydrogenase E1 component